MMDVKDVLIIENLENNAKIPLKKMGFLLGISEPAVRKRIKKLEKEKIILGYKTIINYKKMGYSNKIIMGVDTVPEKYLKVINSLKKIDNIKNIQTCSGDHMIMFEVWIKNILELNIISEKINSIEGVTKSCPSIIHENVD